MKIIRIGIIKAIILAVVLGTLTGCFNLDIYESPVPLGPAEKSTIDPVLLGEWEVLERENDRAMGKTSDDSTIIRFLAFNEHEYVLVSSDNSKKDLVRGFIVKVSGIPFLNLTEVGEEETEFLLCSYSLKEKTETSSGDTELTLKLVGNKLMGKKKIKSSKKLYKFIKKHLNNPDLYATDFTITLKKI